MNIVFVSGFLNNHLLPFCDALAADHIFHFVATEDHQEQGYNRSAIKTHYVVEYYKDNQQDAIIRLIEDADIAIFGGSSDFLLDKRKRTGRLSFIYTERLFKKGTWRRFVPRIRLTYKNRFIENNSNTYILCASSFVKNDVSLLGFTPDRCFKFGYFPSSGEGINNFEIKAKTKNSQIELLYVGRLIQLKRVNDVIACANRLYDSYYKTHLTIIGDGPEREKLEASVNTCQNNRVTFLGELSPDQVYSYMKLSNILFMSSGREEGWGAVVNESLNNGCPVLISDACGSAEYLITNEVNGYIYKCGDISDMTNKAMKLLEHVNEEDLYLSAHKTISECWNGEIAAERFINTCNSILKGKSHRIYEEGPMSPA